MSNYHIALDGILRDTVTGKEGGVYVEILGTEQSHRKAQRILAEIVSQGDWRVKCMGEHSLVYMRDRDGIVEELCLIKKSLRQWQVVKEVRQGEK